MTELSDLYQEVILDHNKRPRNFGRPASSNRTAEGYNPLCGDHITVHLLLEEDVIRDVHFEGSGCAVSKASASMMTEALKGRTLAEAQTLFERFHRLVTGSGAAAGAETAAEPDGRTLSIGKLAVFSGVSEFPMRVKCATLAWHTLRAALDGRAGAVSTE